MTFRNQTLLTAAAAVAAIVVFYIGSSSYTGRDTAGDLVRAVLGLVIFGIAIVQVVRWLKAVPSGLIAVRDNARTRSDHQRRLDRYERDTREQRQAVASYEKAERRRLESLGNARTAREQEERVAIELGHIAHEARRLAASLRDVVVVHHVRDLKTRYAELHQP